MDTPSVKIQAEHSPLLQKVAAVLTQAADQLEAAEAIQKTADVEPGLDRDRVTTMCENLVVLNLAKKADIENAVNTVMGDPGSMISIVESLAQTIVKRADTEQPRQPARLVSQGSLATRPKGENSAAFQQLEASLEGAR